MPKGHPGIDPVGSDIVGSGDRRRDHDGANASLGASSPTDGYLVYVDPASSTSSFGRDGGNPRMLLEVGKEIGRLGW